MLLAFGETEFTNHYLMRRPSAKLLQGTLDMLILKALCHGRMHGYGIAKRITQLADDELTIEEGSLYPALQRLAQQGWITSEWQLSDNNQRARYYNLTKAGRKQLGEDEANWERLSTAVHRVLRSA
jgi:PadR family transcriptional regulator